MSFVLSESQSGLVLATHGADEAAVAAALKQHDPELRLVPQDSDAFGRRVYKVYRYQGSERPAEFVCGWWDEYGQPYDQLSITGLLDKVQAHDRNLRGQHDSLEELERRHRERVAKDNRAEMQAVGDEFAPYVDEKRSSPLPRSQSLRMARDRVRARTAAKELRP